MPISLLWSKPALFLYAAIAIGLAYWGWHNHVWNQGYETREAEYQAAQAKANADARIAADNAIQEYLTNVENDRLVVRLTVDRILSVCQLREAVDAASPANAGLATAEINRTLSEAASDIAYCAVELPRANALRSYIRSTHQ